MTSSSGPRIMEVLSRPPIHDLIFGQLSPAGLVRFSRTCKLAQAGVQSFYNRAFNINRHLSRFFKDPIAFRSLQARTATLISGSSALQFLDRTFYPDSDLDLYVHPGFAREIGRWLIDHEGYEYKPYESQNADFDTQDEVIMKAMRDAGLAPGQRTFSEDLHPFMNQMYRIPGVETVFSFERLNPNAGEDPLKVQIILASQTPLQCILGFHSTIVMNLITYNAAYALYPDATFEKRRAIVMGRMRAERDIQALQKYMRRGWKFQATVPDVPIPDYFRMTMDRSVLDSYTWSIPLSLEGVEPPRPLSLTSDPLTWDPVIFSSFRLQRQHKDDLMYMWYELVSSTVLRFKYLTASEDFLEILRNFFIAQGVLMHMRVDDEQGPAHLIGSEYWAWCGAHLTL
ncbi:hypothetical protein GLOTRDRAFT_31372 [Gloeophyllum trabeum ATCC 11539]|uniref:Uncharacterized protein n=1 Tax=Gloeophyllum trabeum (strain ATCC 11539 / FP-39264 / Madison 617) TaxID=670483 RepID=S7QKP4_GLOTA|nr:uncharacterized protein GLOTRDRAFT_31372 [Gloeophyllum trabeum ATCC 11539]EPQ60361.1 hypothetical protein GLOTRDRAFT_31372 [Gloeophyllum trabeum ATCC 11539]